MLDEESRANGQAVNEQWINAIEEALRRIGFMNPPGMPKWAAPVMYRKIKDALNGIRNESAMNLPIDHSLYMDQQGDEPNKKG